MTPRGRVEIAGQQNRARQFLQYVFQPVDLVLLLERIRPIQMQGCDCYLLSAGNNPHPDHPSSADAAFGLTRRHGQAREDRLAADGLGGARNTIGIVVGKKIDSEQLGDAIESVL